MKITRKTEKGQIVIFLALAVLGLLGITALAIDGGMIYSDQRFSQSAADAASLAGGGAAAAVIDDIDLSSPEWDCSLLTDSIAKGYAAAINKAAANNYTITRDPALGTDSHDHGVLISCSNSGKYLDVAVMLTRVTKTSFLQFFNDDKMRTTAYSKTRVRPRLLGSGGASIVSLSKGCGSKDGGSWFSGTNDTILNGGGVYSNSCVDRNSGSSTVTMYNASVTYHEGSYSAGISDPVPQSDPGFHPLTDEPIPFTTKHCVVDTDGEGYDMPDYGSVSIDSGTINPGVYSSWDFKGPVHLNPGLYCISGDVKMNAAAYVEGTGVTIYYTGTSITLNGGADTGLLAPDGYTDSNPPPHYAVEDLLLYIPPGIIADVVINGNANNTFAGTLFMPDSKVKINGTSDIASATYMQCSIIGYWVTLTGNSDFNITYDSNKEWSWPAYIQLQK